MANCLIIDDSRLARRICRSLVERFGYQVEEAEDGVQGLGLCTQAAFDLILVDLNMPNMGGIFFIQNLRLIPQYIDKPIILCSSDASPMFIRHAMHAGANAYLNKPYSEAALARRLNRLRIAA